MNQTHGIKGINRTALWSAWKAVRQELKNVPYRDVIDYQEYDLNPEVWIGRLLGQISEGHYEPTTPIRYSLAKSKGFSRLMTRPHIPDLVLYRAIADFLYKRASHAQVKHAYFLRATLNQVRQEAEREAVRQLNADVHYRTGTTRSFRQWLKFDQYRKHLIFDRLYNLIVTTDITNFFDSILYNRIEERLYGLRVPPRMIGLLFFILEKLSPRDTYTQSPRIGLPVDEFDCSRTLAHMVLFPHDDRIVARVGQDAYVRWMDDQSIGVNSRSEGLHVLGYLGESLRRLHLTPNASKSKVLNLRDAKSHFHFDANAKLDETQRLITAKRSHYATNKSFSAAWQLARKREDEGEWEKILKRCYGIGALVRSKRLRSRAPRDVLVHPQITDRIVDYIRCTGTAGNHIKFVQKLIGHPEQVYKDVNHLLFESLLRVEPGKQQAKLICDWAIEILCDRHFALKLKECASTAPLVLLRFGDGRSLRRLMTCLSRGNDMQPVPVIRACAIVYLSNGNDCFDEIRKHAARILRNPLGDVVKMVEHVRELKDVPQRFHPRLDVRFDSLKRKPFLDMRSILQARLLTLNPRPNVVRWLREKKKQLLNTKLSAYDKRLIRRLF